MRPTASEMRACCIAATSSGLVRVRSSWVKSLQLLDSRVQRLDRLQDLRRVGDALGAFERIAQVASDLLDRDLFQTSDESG